MPSIFDLNGDGKVDAEDGKLLIDHLMTFYQTVSAPRYKREQHAIIGTVALFYARSFPYTIMFAQAFRVTGWPVVKEGLAKLSIEFEKGRDELSRQGLSFADAKNVLSNYRTQLVALQKMYDDARIISESKTSSAKEVAAATSRMASAQTDMDRLHSTYKRASAVVSSASAVLQALDPAVVLNAASRIWVGISTCVMTAVSPGAQCMSLGVSVGDRLSSATRLLYRKLFSKRGADGRLRGLPNDESEQKWGDLCFDSVFKAIGVASAFYMQHIANAFEGCMLGAHLITDVIKGELDKAGTAVDPHIVNSLQLTLVAVGVMSQFRTSDGGQVPFLLRPLLFLPLTLESILSAFASRAMWSSS